MGQRWDEDFGGFLGSDVFQKKNWEGVVEKVCARLSRWKWVLPQLSYRGRVLVANNLAASTLWHRLMILQPPKGLIQELQRTLVNFFWSGQHWIKAAALYLPLHEGGQGLVDISSRIMAFRLHAAQRLLYRDGSSWVDTAYILMRRVGCLGLDKHLFLLKLEGGDLPGLTPFYESVMQAWRVFVKSRKASTPPGMWLFKEPLFHNTAIQSRVLGSASLRSCLLGVGCTKLGHLMRNRNRSLEELGERAGIRSSRLLRKVVAEVCDSLPVLHLQYVTDISNSDRWKEGLDYVFPALIVSAAAGAFVEDMGMLLSFDTPELGEFKEVGKKAMYRVCVKVSHASSLEGVKSTRWADVLGPGASPKGCWRSLYKLPIDKRTADLQWRIIHGAIATNMHLVHLDPTVGEGCPFCAESETLAHLFLQCPRLVGMIDLITSWFSVLGEVFSSQLFIFGLKYRLFGDSLLQTG